MTPRTIRSDQTPSSEGVVVSRFGIRGARCLTMLLVLLAASVFAGPGSAQRIQDRPNQAEADRAIDQLRSPYCPGFMLRVCTSGQAAALRDSIYDLAGQGMTSDELVEWMIGRHGEEWRAVPKRSGAGLLAWVTPPAAVLIAVGLVVMWLRGHRARDEDIPATVGAKLSEADQRELTRALREWKDDGEEGL